MKHFLTGVKAVFDIRLQVNNNLRDFQHGVAVDAREIGYKILEVEHKFGFSRTTPVKRCSFKHPGKTSNFRHQCLHKKPFSERNQRQLFKIVSLDRR